jgi:N-acetylmuramoyl-L-alanine amidase
MIEQGHQFVQLPARGTQSQIKDWLQFMPRVSLHSIARLVIESSERYPQLQQKLCLRCMLMFDIEGFATGVFQTAHTQITQNDYQQKQNRKTADQREQGRVKPPLARLIRLFIDPGSGAKDNFAIGRLDWVRFVRH